MKAVIQADKKMIHPRMIHPRKRKAGVALALSLLLMPGLSACQYGGENEAGLTFFGGALGAMLAGMAGGDSNEVLLGATLGSLAGGAYGRSLDAQDRARMREAQQVAFNSSTPSERVTWVNPKSGNSGEIHTRPPYQARGGGYCREYTQDIYVSGERKTGYGRACRQPDGSWKIVN